MVTGDEYMNKMFESYQRLANELDCYLIEGLNVDEIHRTVSLTDDHSDGVDFSNQSYLHFKYNIDGQKIDVYSIFKRTSLEGSFSNLDGNPFIYALKRKDNWKFDITDEQIVHYIRRFLEVCNTIDKKYDTIITVPSAHDINRRFMEVISTRVGANNLINDMFRKCTKAEAFEDIDTEAIEAYCDKHSPRMSDLMYDKIMGEIRASFIRMDGKYFQAKKVRKEYLKFCPAIVSIKNGFTAEKASEYISGKSVLVLDDTISSGASVSACVRAINTFDPKKLDVITLLSKKVNK